MGTMDYTYFTCFWQRLVAVKGFCHKHKCNLDISILTQIKILGNTLVIQYLH